MVLFDRSWYNRAGVERVMGFATLEQVEHFLKEVPAFEKAIIDSGTIFIKYWLDVSMENQAERFGERLTDPRKHWKPVRSTWRHRSAGTITHGHGMPCSLPRTPIDAPWYVVDANDQQRARLNCIAHLLSLVPYEELPRPEIKLPKRQSKGTLQ